MGKWFKEYQALIWAASIGIGAVTWVGTSISASAEKVETNMKDYVDSVRDADRKMLEEVHKDVREIRKIVMERR